MAGGQIELVALTKRFTEVAVDGIDLTVHSGEFLSLLGPQAAGRPPPCGSSLTPGSTRDHDAMTLLSMIASGDEAQARPPSCPSGAIG